MNINYPIIQNHNKELKIIFSSLFDENKALDIEIVLDLDNNNDIVGFEILNLKLKAGHDCLTIIENIFSTGNYKNMRYGFDDETDAFYMKLFDGRSINQIAVNGVIVLNNIGNIVEIYSRE